jgi:hypothetical protein
MSTTSPPEPTSTAVPPIDLRERREQRLAELVAGLTGCDEHGALHALREQPGPHIDALQRVASAIVAVDRPAPGRFRIAGYLRDDLPALATR